MDTDGLPLAGWPGYVGSVNFSLRFDDSLDLTLFLDGLPVLVRRCVGPYPQGLMYTACEMVLARLLHRKPDL